MKRVQLPLKEFMAYQMALDELRRPSLWKLIWKLFI